MKNVRVGAVLVACIGGASIVFAAPGGHISMLAGSVPSTPVSSRRSSISSRPPTSSSSPGDVRTDISQSQSINSSTQPSRASTPNSDEDDTESLGPDQQQDYGIWLDGDPHASVLFDPPRSLSVSSRSSTSSRDVGSRRSRSQSMTSGAQRSRASTPNSVGHGPENMRLDEQQADGTVLDDDPTASMPVNSRRPSASSHSSTSSRSSVDVKSREAQSQSVTSGATKSRVPTPKPDEDAPPHHQKTEGTPVDHNTPDQHSSTADLPSAEHTRDDKVPGVHIFHTLGDNDGGPHDAPGSLQVYDISSSYSDYNAPPPPYPWYPSLRNFFNEHGLSPKRGETETTYMNRLIASYFNRRGFGPGLYRSMIEQFGAKLGDRSSDWVGLRVWNFLDDAELMADGKIPRNNNYGP